MTNDSITISGYVRDGKMPHKCGEMVRSLIARMEGQKVDITVAKAKKRRSNGQNAFYYGVVIPAVKELFSASGDTVSETFVHTYLKAEIGGFKTMITMPDGTKRYACDSSTKLSTMQWEDWMDKIRAWAAEYDVMIPFPNEGQNEDRQNNAVGHRDGTQHGICDQSILP